MTVIKTIAEAITRSKQECAQAIYDYIIDNKELIDYLYTHQYLYLQNSLSNLPFGGGYDRITIYYKIHAGSKTTIQSLSNFVDYTVRKEDVTPETYALLFTRLKEAFALVQEAMVQDETIERYQAVTKAVKEHQGLLNEDVYDFGDD